MPTLDYQKSDDAGREVRAGWRRKIFGLSKAEVWAASRMRSMPRHESGGWWKSDRVVAAVGAWQITLNTYLLQRQDLDDLHAATRVRHRDGLRFRIYRRSIFSGLGKFLGMQDIEIGDWFFDENFIIQSDRPAQVKRLLDSVELRNQLQVQPRVMFHVKDDEMVGAANSPRTSTS